MHLFTRFQFLFLFLVILNIDSPIYASDFFTEITNSCLKKGNEIIHPIETFFWGEDGVDPLIKQDIPYDLSLDEEYKSYDFFLFQEKIWSNQEGIITLNNKIHLLEKKLKKARSKKKKKCYEQEMIEHQSLIFKWSAEIVDWKLELSDILEKGDVIALRVLGAGVHPSFIATLTLDHKRVIQAILKPDRVLDIGANSYAEAAAYELDYLLDFRMVPMVRQRTFGNGKNVSLQYFITGGVVGKKLPELKRVIPARAYRFDYLIRQWDRENNAGNFLYLALENPATKKIQTKFVAIDHGTALATNSFSHYFDVKKIFNLKKGRIINFLDSDYEQYLRIKKLREDVLTVWAPHLSSKQRQMVLKRRDQFIKSTEKLMFKLKFSDEKAFFKYLRLSDGKIAFPINI